MILCVFIHWQADQLPAVVPNSPIVVTCLLSQLGFHEIVDTSVPSSKVSDDSGSDGGVRVDGGGPSSSGGESSNSSLLLLHHPYILEDIPCFDAMNALSFFMDISNACHSYNHIPPLRQQPHNNNSHGGHSGHHVKKGLARFQHRRNLEGHKTFSATLQYSSPPTVENTSKQSRHSQLQLQPQPQQQQIIDESDISNYLIFDIASLNATSMHDLRGDGHGECTFFHCVFNSTLSVLYVKVQVTSPATKQQQQHHSSDVHPSRGKSRRSHRRYRKNKHHIETTTPHGPLISSLSLSSSCSSSSSSSSDDEEEEAVSSPKTVPGHTSAFVANRSTVTGPSWLAANNSTNSSTGARRGVSKGQFVTLVDIAESLRAKVIVVLLDSHTDQSILRTLIFLGFQLRKFPKRTIPSNSNNMASSVVALECACTPSALNVPLPCTLLSPLNKKHANSSSSSSSQPIPQQIHHVLSYTLTNNSTMDDNIPAISSTTALTLPPTPHAMSSFELIADEFPSSSHPGIDRLVEAAIPTKSFPVHALYASKRSYSSVVDHDAVVGSIDPSVEYVILPPVLTSTQFDEQPAAATSSSPIPLPPSEDNIPIGELLVEESFMSSSNSIIVNGFGLPRIEEGD